MELTNTITLPVTQAQAWAALNDMGLLQQAVPGCESLTAVGELEYEALVVAAVGPVKAKFKGRLRLSELNPPHSYRLQFEGQGGQAGHGKGSAQVRLQAQGERETLLSYTASASVGGKLAQVGSRLVDMAAQKMAGEFFERFTEALRQRHPAAAAPPPPPPVGWWVRLVAWLRHRLGRRAS